jgi:hypothetical protein
LTDDAGGGDDDFDQMTTAVLFDIFADTETQLSASYIRMSREAESAEQRAMWWTKVIELRDRQRAVRHDDRREMVNCIREWREEMQRIYHNR